MTDTLSDSIQPPPTPSDTATASHVPTPTLTAAPTPSPTASSSASSFVSGTELVTPTPQSSRSRTETSNATASRTILPTSTATLLALRRPCPALAMNTSVLPLTQSVINSGSGVLLVAALPPGYRWTSVDYTPLVRFADAFNSQPGGFAGGFGDLLRLAAWFNVDGGGSPNASLAYRQIACVLPTLDSYFISLPEEIVVSVSGDAVVDGCSGEAQGTFTVVPDHESLLIRVVSILGFGVGSIATLASLLTGGSAGLADLQTLALFSQMKCAPAAVAVSAGPMRYFLSPFADLGLVAMCLGNIGVVVGFTALHAAFRGHIQSSRHVDATTAAAIVRFPSFSYVVAQILHAGIAFAACSALIGLRSGFDALSLVTGIVGMAYIIALPLALRAALASQANIQFVKYWQFLPFAPLRRAMYPIGYFTPVSQRQIFGSLLSPMRGRYMFLGAYPLVVLTVVCIVAALRPSPQQCYMQYAALAAFLGAVAVVVAWRNPHRSGFLTLCSVLLYVCQAIVMAISAVDARTPTPITTDVLVLAAMLLIVVVLLRTGYTVATNYLETTRWQLLQTPKRNDLDDFLDGDAPSTGAPQSEFRNPSELSDEVLFSGRPFAQAGASDESTDEVSAESVPIAIPPPFPLSEFVAILDDDDDLFDVPLPLERPMPVGPAAVSSRGNAPDASDESNDSTSDTGSGSNVGRARPKPKPKRRHRESSSSSSAPSSAASSSSEDDDFVDL